MFFFVFFFRVFSILMGTLVGLLPSSTSKKFSPSPRLLSWPAVDFFFFQVVAGTFNVVKAGRFYGRYWGAFEKVKNLHFEACCESGGCAFPR